MASVKGSVVVNYNTVQVTNDFRARVFSAVEQLFEGDIRDTAIENSPYDTGNNRRSIDVEVKWVNGVGVVATIFTTSGYGGYLELGHRVRLGVGTSNLGKQLFASIRGGQADFVQGRPYIYPAVMSNLPKLYALLGQPVPTGAVYTDLFTGPIGDTYTGGTAHARAVRKEVIRKLKGGKGSYAQRLRSSKKVTIG